MTFSLIQRQELSILRAHLLGLLKNTAIISTQADQHEVVGLIQLVEIIADGKVTTPWPGTHHE